MTESLPNIAIQPLPSLSAKDMPVDILRLDELHPVISGNKWFKLKYYIQDAIEQGKDTIATFGGAWSNHIVATAFASREAGLRSIGFIRGEESATPSSALADAQRYGMKLVYIDRARYRDTTSVRTQYADGNLYWVMEGGYGVPGAKGAADILKTARTSPYTDILCATGTGTMAAGLIAAAQPHQTVTGISVLKNNHNIESDIESLLPAGHRPFVINHEYHFGGYAKHPKELVAFMNELWNRERLPTDIVYTSKLLFAAKDLLGKEYFAPRARILLIHSGGLQGNRSLPPGTLIF